MAKPDMVYIKHPDVDAIGYVVRSAFEDEGGHKDQGWEIAGPDDYKIVTNEEGQTRPVPATAVLTTVEKPNGTASLYVTPNFTPASAKGTAPKAPTTTQKGA